MDHYTFLDERKDLQSVGFEASMSTSLVAFAIDLLGIFGVLKDDHGPRLVFLLVELYEDAQDLDILGLVLEMMGYIEIIFYLKLPPMLISLDVGFVWNGRTCGECSEVDILSFPLTFALGLEFLHCDFLVLENDGLDLDSFKELVNDILRFELNISVS